MAKLAPPIVEGTIPAFYGTVLTVPFAMNKSVSTMQVKQMVLKIKTISSSTYLETVYTNPDFQTSTASFIITSNLFNPGQYYKIQLAYQDLSGEIGYFSAVSVIKYTTKPVVSIEGLNKSTANARQLSYVGLYEQAAGAESDTTEKVYTYNFTIYDKNNNIFATSGEQLHNSLNDTQYNCSSDTFECNYELQIGELYYIQYTVTTINNLVISSSKYRIQQKMSIDPELNASIQVELCYDDGYISVSLNPFQENGLNKTTSGSFLLSRACADNNYSKWDNLQYYRFDQIVAQGEIFKDFTIEQGKTYKYALSQYNDNGLYSNRKISKEIYSDFEDIFLYDGARQLKIRFNPQISSFKTDVLEQKTDTIGSKYPFIFRNGSVNYKEFSISGLISYFMDENQFFFTDNDMLLTTDNATREETASAMLDAPHTRTHNLIGYNFMAERTFKLEVLDWLNDGNIKLFRSPAEGNYLVRLMNSSLAPNATVGRLLHTFTSTAYEMADCTYDNLVNYGIITKNNITAAELQWKTLLASDIMAQNTNEIQAFNNIDYVRINNNTINTLALEGLIPGTIIYILDNNQALQPITIGVTGAYYIDDTISVNKVYLPKTTLEQNPNLTILYSYYDIVPNKFNQIDSVTDEIIPTRQFFNGEDISAQLQNVYYYNYIESDDGTIYILTQITDKNANTPPIKDIRTNITAINRITFSLKEGLGQRLYTYIQTNNGTKYQYISNPEKNTISVQPYDWNSKDIKNIYFTKNLLDAMEIKSYADSSIKWQYVYDLTNLDPYYLYPVYNQDELLIGYLCRNSDGVACLVQTTKFSNTTTGIKTNDAGLTEDYSSNQISIKKFNQEEDKILLDLTDTSYFSTQFLTDIPEGLTIGANVRADIIYSANIITYQLESADTQVAAAKAVWEEAKTAYNKLLNNAEEYTQQKQAKAFAIMQNAYYDFIKQLTAAIAKKEE